MARFDVYVHPDAVERKRIPYLLDVQNTYLAGLSTTVVIPLCKPSTMPLPVRDLHPTLNVQGTEVIMNTSDLGPVPSGMLRAPVTQLTGQQSTIQTALDTLFGAY